MNLLLLEPGERALDRRDTRARHIRTVLKLRVGDEVRAGEVGGALGTARIVAEESGRYTLDFEPRALPIPPPPVCLVLGHPRPIVLRRLLRDLAAIGPAGVVVTHTDLGEKSYYESNLWADVRTPLLDGASQGGTTLLPVVRRARSLHEAAAEARTIVAGALVAGEPGSAGGGPEDARHTGSSPEPLRLVLHAEQPAAPSLVRTLGTLDPGTPLVLAVGSERGWTPREVDTLGELRYTAASLGRRVLRTETAAIAATWAAVSWYDREP